MYITVREFTTWRHISAYKSYTKPCTVQHVWCLCMHVHAKPVSENYQTFWLWCFVVAQSWVVHHRDRLLERIDGNALRTCLARLFWLLWQIQKRNSCKVWYLIESQSDGGDTKGNRSPKEFHTFTIFKPLPPSLCDRSCSMAVRTSRCRSTEDDTFASVLMLLDVLKSTFWQTTSKALIAKGLSLVIARQYHKQYKSESVLACKLLIKRWRCIQVIRTSPA